MKAIYGAVSLMVAILVSASATQASPYYSGGRSNFTGQVGFSSTATNFGFSYENRLDVLGLGGYFLQSTEKRSVNNQVTSFGAIAPAHLLDDNRLDVYLGPGFGIHMLKGFPGQDDVTTFGPLWKMGFLFKLTPSVRMGLEQTVIVNWFTDKYGRQYSYTNAAFSFAL